MLQAIVTELEDKINSVFEINDENIADNPRTPRRNTNMPSQSKQSKSVFKKPKGRAVRKKRQKKVADDSDDDDDEVTDEEKENNSVNVSCSRKSSRKPKPRKDRNIFDDDSD